MSYPSETPERRREYRRRNYEKHRESILAKTRARYAANRERALAASHVRYMARREAILEKSRADRQANPEKYRERDRKQNAKNPKMHVRGESFRVNSLPEELRPVALLVLETGRALKRRT